MREEALFSRGQQDARIYLVVSGMVKLVHVSVEGKIGVAAVRGPGEVFGELAVSGPVIRDHSAIALSPATILAAPAEAVLREVAARKLLAGFIARLSARVLDQQGFITNLLTVDCEHRLARIILEIAGKGAQYDGQGAPVTVPLRQSDLAEMVGTSRSRIGGFLKRFSEFGWVRVDRDGCIAVQGRDLAQFAGGVASLESEASFAARNVTSKHSRAASSRNAPTVNSRVQVQAGMRVREVPPGRANDVSMESLALPSMAYSLQAIGRRRVRTTVKKASRTKR